jgi:hypothetical protein
MRSMVEGARGAEASREADAPPTALCAVPPPRFAGRDEASVARVERSETRGSVAVDTRFSLPLNPG